MAVTTAIEPPAARTLLRSHAPAHRTSAPTLAQAKRVQRLGWTQRFGTTAKRAESAAAVRHTGLSDSEERVTVRKTALMGSSRLGSAMAPATAPSEDQLSHQLNQPAARASSP